jgi:uncharacterized membrane protein YdjX (TVP38/TMEM64 family)
MQNNEFPVVKHPINYQFLFKCFFFLALIIFGTYLFIHYDLYYLFIHKKRAIGFVMSFHPYDEIVFIAMQVLQVLVAPIPGEASGLIGGYLYGPVLGTIYSTIGLTIGSWIAFALARNFGLPLVEMAVKPEILQKYDYVMEHRGVLVSFILFMIPGFPKDYLCYIIGLSHMGTGTFIIISTMGRLFGTILLSVSGSFARNGQYTTLLVIGTVSGILILAGYLYRDRLMEILKKKKSEA